MQKKVLITGASKGLGFYLVKNFLKEGYFVIATYRKDKNFLKEIESENNLYLVEMDVSNELSVKNALSKTKEITDRLDILINNAAVYLEGKKPTPVLEEIEINKALQTYDINALGALRVLKYFFPLLKQESIILNISSEAGSISNCWRDREFGYCMSKAALNMLTMIVSNYSKDKGIKVFSIHPGWMKTEMGGMEADIFPEDAAKGILKFISSVKDKTKNFYDYNGNPMNW